jgi:hypothetical protein
MNEFGKRGRSTDKNGAIVDFYLYLAANFVTIRQLIQRARSCYQWTPDPPQAD